MVVLYFYSRCPGWDSPEHPQRYYLSPGVELPAEQAQRYIGLTGAAIARQNAAPEALRNLARVYDTWHLYPAGTCVGCGPEHCV